MSDNAYAWWVTSDPDHPFNAAHPEPEAPKMSEPEPGPNPQQVAAEAMAKAQAEGLARAQAAAAEGLAKAQATAPVAAPVSDARPSTIPDNLIPPAGTAVVPQGTK